MLLTVTSLFCISTTPVAVAIVVSSFSPTLIPILAWEFLILVQFVNHSLNVLMYISVSAQFRKQFKVILCLCCKRVRNKSSEHSMNSNSTDSVSANITESVDLNRF